MTFVLELLQCRKKKSKISYRIFHLKSNIALLSFNNQERSEKVRLKRHLKALSFRIFDSVVNIVAK